MMLFKSRKEKQAEKAERIQKMHKELEQLTNQGKDKYDIICSVVQKELESANKPAACNTVKFKEESYLFSHIPGYLYVYDEWEIWKTNDKIYFYRSEIPGYPEEYLGADAPAIGSISIDQIIHFRIEGSTYTESKISGGKVTQDRQTGRIKQTAIKSTTVHHDDRYVKLSVSVNGVVKSLAFEYPAYDVFCHLIPDKEHS